MLFMLQLCGDARMDYGTMCVLETCDGARQVPGMDLRGEYVLCEGIKIWGLW